MKKRLAGAVVLATAITVAAAIASAASAAIVITRIHYNSPGADTGSNTSLNGEWIRLKNTGTQARWLTNWRIRDVAAHIYTFGTYKLGAGKTVTVHAGSGTNTARHRYWGNGSYIWNNNKDTATLRRPNGTVADKCSYNNSSASFKGC